MNFTTTTKIAREGRKAFESGCKTVLVNNEPVGMIFGTDYYRALIDSGLLDEIREYMWEMNDEQTVQLVTDYRSGKESDSISLEDYAQKHDL